MIEPTSEQEAEREEDNLRKDPHEEDSFWGTPIDIEKLAAQQGVQPVTNFEDLLGDFWPEDESAEDFLETLRQWRSGGRDRTTP